MGTALRLGAVPHAASSTRLGSHGAFFRRHLAPRSRVLEAGCGVGLWLRRLTDCGYRAVGLDYAVRSLRARRAPRRTSRSSAGICAAFRSRTRASTPT